MTLAAPFPTPDSSLNGRLQAQAQAPGPTAPTFRTGANYVRVDVYATQNGTPLTDLRQDEFTVLEDGKPQEIDRFEFINIRDGGQAPVFLEPATVSAARQPNADGRTRLFVLFLDRPHVDDKGSGTIREPLLNMLRRTISDRDLVAVMTPDMTVNELTFSTKTAALEAFIERDRFWGERSRLAGVDPFETELKRCYPYSPDLVEELIARRREKRTMDAVQSLVEYLGNLREERKAILLFSSGWLRFEPTRKFDDLGGQPPIAPPATGPLPGRGTASTDAQISAEYRAACFAERNVLASIDHQFVMDQVMALANRGNTSFYPIDPRGLAVFDDPDKVLGGGQASMEQDRRNLSKRLSALRELADGTDGLAIVNTNSLDAGLRRIVDDLSSYYLLSYASNGALDGKFHSIAVRTSRPGVSIRARRGFLAAKPAASTTSAAMAAPSPVAADAMTTAAKSALDRLAASVRDVPAGAMVAAGWVSRGTSIAPSFTIVGEIRDKTKGATIDVIITSPDGTMVGSGRGPIAAGSGSAILNIDGADGVRPGAYTALIRIQDANGTETLRVPVSLQVAPVGTGAIYYRRGPTTGNREIATADLRFRRSDRIRIDVPSTSETTGDVRLLDRNANPINVPLESSTRADNAGVRWTSVSLSPSPLAAGDYLVEFATAGQRVMVPFKVVP